MAENAPNKSDMEQAEGSRETVESNLGTDDGGAGQRYDTDKAQRGASHDEDEEDAGGITNRPLDQEIENQRELPSRGTARDPEKDHA